MRPIDETTILITGATDGLGRGVARELARRGAELLLHGRSQERLDATAAEIRDETPGARLRTLTADLAALDEVRALADEVEATTDALHVVISNAGVGSGLPTGRERAVSRDGHELRFAVNHLAGFLLTQRLLPLLQRSAPARIVHVASLGQAPVDFDDVMLERAYDGTRAYSQSKLAQITAGFEQAARLDPDLVTVTSLHPSTYMPTKMVLEEVGSAIDTLEAGVKATVRLAVAPELEGVTGRFFDRQSEARPHPQALDRAARRRLYDLSRELTGAPDVP